MTICELYFSCGNLYKNTNFRIRSHPLSDARLIYKGDFGHMPEEIKRMTVDVFELDDDLKGVLIVAK